MVTQVRCVRDKPLIGVASATQASRCTSETWPKDGGGGGGVVLHICRVQHCFIHSSYPVPLGSMTIFLFVPLAFKVSVGFPQS
jgi:hypothetical protein